jgi:steroid delta-isomerase
MNREELEGLIKGYFETVRSMEMERLITFFAEDATLEEPVGRPAAAGHDQIRRLLKGTSKIFNRFDMNTDFIRLIPPEAVVKWTTVAETHGGLEVSFQGISYFKFRDDGKILQMRAFWYAEELVEKLKV